IASVGLVGLFGPFRNTEKKLSEMREWVQMRDFVLNYPPQIINSIKKTALFISALLPDTFITTGMAIGDLIFNQFRSPQFMLDTLKIFFSNAKLLPSIPLVNSPSCEEWMIAIHQFQSLPIEAQLALGPYLARIAKASKDFQVVQLPKEVKLVLLNEHLKSFAKIPSNEEEQKYSEWILAVKPFNSLNADQQAIFGEQTSRLIRASSPSGPLAGSNELRRAALKQSLKLFVQKPSDAEWTWALRLMQSLPIEMYKDFGTESEVYARNLTSDQTNRLPPLMQFSLLHHTLSSVERVPLNSHMDVRWTYINYLYYYLPENMRPHSDIETQLNRIAKVSEQGLINALPNTELKARLLHLKASCGSVNATEG
ncbi:MAG TPA: hypothetical protein VMR37_03640, partial [Rhabdochlamydiaceae bacterium]|nr:hypothetical protein [Rhabdochlamydiaceae bacterium]